MAPTMARQTARERYYFPHGQPQAYTLPGSQKTLYILRTVEILVTIIYLVLLIISVVNHGWWNKLGQPLAFGITASVLTIFVAVPTFLGYTSQRATRSRSQFALYSLRVVVELVVLAFWSAAFVTMLLPKGKDFRLLFVRPPYAEWDIAIVLSVLQIFLVIYTLVIVYHEKYLTDPNPFSASMELGRVRVR